MGVSIKTFIDTGTLVLLLTLFMVQLPATIATSYIIATIYLLAKGFKSPLRLIHVKFYLLLTAAVILPALTFNHGMTPLFYMVVSPFLALLAHDFSRNSLYHIQCVLRNIYWIFIAFIAFALIQHWGDPEPLGAILPWASTNGIPSYLIVIQIAYSMAFYLKNDRLPLTSSSVTLAVAIAGLGRGSMIIGFCILVMSIFCNLFILKAKNDRVIAFRIILVGLIPMLVLVADRMQEITETVDTLIEGSKFASGVLDEHRGKIITDYLAKMDSLSILVGADYHHTAIDQYYGGNPHNSFIRIHSFYGVIALFALFVPLLLITISRRDPAQKWIASMLIVLALVRAGSEPIFFPSTLDFFYFLYFAIFFRFSRGSLQFCGVKNHAFEIDCRKNI